MVRPKSKFSDKADRLHSEIRDAVLDWEKGLAEGRWKACVALRSVPLMTEVAYLLADDTTGAQGYDLCTLIIRSLAKTGDPAVLPALERIMRVNDNPYIKEHVLNVIKGLPKGDPTSYQAFVETFENQASDCEARSAAAQTLHEVGWSPPPESEFLFFVLSKQWDRCADHPQAEIPVLLDLLEDWEGGRRELITLIGRVGNAQCVDALLSFLPVWPMRCDGPELQNEVVRALGDIGDTRAIMPIVMSVPHLIRIPPDRTMLARVETAARALQLFPRNVVLDQIIDHLESGSHHDDEYSRISKLLEMTVTQADAPRFISLLDHESVDILYLAGGVLVHLRCRDAIDHLQRIASASEADEFRRSTASTLLRLFDV